MNDVVWICERTVILVVLCLPIFYLRGTSTQSIGPEVRNITWQGINGIQGLGQEFAANFFTDLAPLLILFGDQVVRQYMAQSQDWADHIIFAMGPLGVATALTGAVRICGQKFLRGVVGRGRETKQMAEFELTSATSEDVYEVWDGESIVRVMGEQTFQEIRLQKEGGKVVIKQLFQDVAEKDTHIPVWERWSDKVNRRTLVSTNTTPNSLEKALPNDEGTQDKMSIYRRKTQMGPNLSLNAIPEDISPLKKWTFAIISVLLQIFVIAWAALVQYKFPTSKFRKDWRMGEFRTYAFPCMAVGTIFVMTSMLFCSYVVDKAMERKHWTLEARATERKHGKLETDLKPPVAWRPCWIQKWDKADDQTFDSYLIIGSLRNTRNPGDALVTLHPRRQPQQEGPTNPESAGHLGEREIPGLLVRLTEVACVLGIVGFFVMVAGTRSLHWSVPATQLGQTLVMALLRSYVRRKMNADDIRAVKLPRGFEIEWLVTRRDELWEKLENWDRNDDFWKPEANNKWSLVTGEKVVRAEEITKERGSITMGQTLTEISCEKSEKIIEFETLDTLDEEGNIKPKVGAQMALNDLKGLLHSNKKWEGNASRLGKALVKTMECTLNTLLPPAVMNSDPSLNRRIGLVNRAPAPTPMASVQPWPGGAKGRVWLWPIVVQVGVNSVGGAGKQVQMEEQIVRISLIQRETGGWFVMKEGVEALLTLWLFTLKQQRINFIKHIKPDHFNMLPAFVRLMGSNTELTRWDIMRWYVDHCSRVYEGKCMTFTAANREVKEKDEVDIRMDCSLCQVMGIEQVDLRSEDELAKGQKGGTQRSEDEPAKGQEGGTQQTPVPNGHEATMHYFRGRELPQVWYEDWPESRDERYTSLATTVECTLEELCAQEILFRFFFAIGTFMREEREIRVLGNTILSYRNTTASTSTTSSKSLDSNDAALEKRLKAAKFHNPILERIALEAYCSKVCGSLEEAYQCIIPAFSQARVLPEVGEVVGSQVTQIFRELVGKGDWIKACDLYNWVWNSMGCKFPHHSNEDLYVISLFTNFVRKLRHEASTGCHGGSLTKELTTKGEEMLKLITEQEFQGRDVVRALGLMLQIDELDGPMQARMAGGELTEADSAQLTSRRNSQEGSDGHGAPDEGVPESSDEKLFELLGFTSSHKSTANIVGAGAPVSTDLERDANIPDIFQRRPLHYAAANPKLDIPILELLIRKTSGVDQRDINGNTPLHLAAARNNPSFTAGLKKLSLEEDPEMQRKTMVDFNATNELKWTPLHFAAYKGHKDMLDELIKEGAIIDVDDNIGRSPLHWAAQGGHPSVVTALIQKGANTDTVDAYGRSPLHVAASIGNGEVAAELVSHGVRLGNADTEGKTALDLAIETLEKWTEKEKAWLDCEEEKAAYQVPLARDIVKSFGPLLDTLLVSKEEKAKGWTALHCAAHQGDAQAVAMLLDLDAKQNANFDTEKRITNQTDHVHETALHVAARGGHLKVVKILVSDKSANPRIRNNFGEDVLMIAVKNNRPDVVSVLLEAAGHEGLRITWE